MCDVWWVLTPSSWSTPCVPRLEEDLKCTTKVGGTTSDQLLRAIGSNMPGLQQLNLSHTARMEASPAAFRQLGAALTTLTALDLSEYPLLFAAAAATGEVVDGDVLLVFQQLRSLKVCPPSGSDCWRPVQLPGTLTA
jgi:hypothetical protein